MANFLQKLLNGTDEAGGENTKRRRELPVSVLAGMAGLIVSFAATPLTFGMSIIVGAATFLGTVAGGKLGKIAGGAVGGTAEKIGDFFTKKNKSKLAKVSLGIAASAAMLGGAGGAAIAAYEGYALSKNALLEKSCQTEYNRAACLKIGKPVVTPPWEQPSSRPVVEPAQAPIKTPAG